jgi:hypothetical protein
MNRSQVLNLQNGIQSPTLQGLTQLGNLDSSSRSCYPRIVSSQSASDRCWPGAYPFKRKLPSNSHRPFEITATEQCQIHSNENVDSTTKICLLSFVLGLNNQLRNSEPKEQKLNDFINLVLIFNTRSSLPKPSTKSKLRGRTGNMIEPQSSVSKEHSSHRSHQDLYSYTKPDAHRLCSARAISITLSFLSRIPSYSQWSTVKCRKKVGEKNENT